MFLFVVVSLVSAIIHEKSKHILNVEQQEKYANALWLPAAFDRAKHYYSQHEAGFWLRRSLSEASRKDYEHATKYFEEQLPYFEQSFKNYPLHLHWSSLELPRTVSFHDLINQRGKKLVRNLFEHNWEDYKIEKDKCSMFEFLGGNGLPHVPWVSILRYNINKENNKPVNDNTNSVQEGEDHARYYQNLTAMLTRMKQILSSATEFPMFIKSCHITTGAAKSVYRIMDKSHVQQRWPEIESWAYRMWRYRSNDWERQWAIPFNTLTAQLQPGFMIQGPWMANRKENPVEIKVEVIWGRAYLAFVSTGRCGGDTIILRDGTVTRYTDSLMQNILHQGHADPCYQWIVDEGHLPRAWFMAESAARLMGIDAIRIDIFLLRGDPMASVINEDSLSSGAEYRWHFQHMANLWAMGHSLKKYQVVDPQVDSHRWFRGKDFYTTKIAKCNYTLSSSLSKPACASTPVHV